MFHSLIPFIIYYYIHGLMYGPQLAMWNIKVHTIVESDSMINKIMLAM